MCVFQFLSPRCVAGYVANVSVACIVFLPPTPCVCCWLATELDGLAFRYNPPLGGVTNDSSTLHQRPGCRIFLLATSAPVLKSFMGGPGENVQRHPLSPRATFVAGYYLTRHVLGF